MEINKQEQLQAELATLLAKKVTSDSNTPTLIARMYDGVKTYAVYTKDDIRYLDNNRLERRVARLKARG